MRRRAFLAAVAGGLSAGCVGSLGGDRTATLTPAPVPASPTVRPTPTATATPDVRSLGPRQCEGDGFRLGGEAIPERPDPPERYADLGCPSIEWADRVVCSHRSDLADAPAVLLGLGHLVDLVGETGDVVEFVLVNRSGAGVDLRFHTSEWGVLTPPSGGRGWEPVALGRQGCARSMGPTWEHWWQIGVNTDPGPTPALNETAGRVDLEPGAYAFALPAVVAGGQSVVCLAPFTVRRILGAPGDSAARTDSGATDDAD
jgi:hypothetical protein